MGLKITKKDRAFFKSLAKKFPDLPLENGTVLVRMTGSSILNNNGSKTDKEGLSIDPNKVYVGEAGRMLVNHERRLIKAYEAGGMKEVQKYVDSVKDYVAKQNKKQEIIEQAAKKKLAKEGDIPNEQN